MPPCPRSQPHPHLILTVLCPSHSTPQHHFTQHHFTTLRYAMLSLLSRSPIGSRAPLRPLLVNIFSRSKTTSLSLAAKHRRSEKITMVTAYDYPSALHVDRAGIDLLLVGDSVGMVELGMETTQKVTMDQMIHHCVAVSRGATNPMLIGDMPLGSYEVNDER